MHGGLFRGATLVLTRSFDVAVCCQILAVLPGLTYNNVISSKVGRAVKKIWKLGNANGFETSTADMANWVMTNWKRKLLKIDDKPGSQAATSLSHNNSNGTTSKKKEEPRGEKSETTSSQLKKSGPKSGDESAQVQRSNSAGHLQDLLGTSAPTIWPNAALWRMRSLDCCLHAGSRGKSSRDVLGSALGGKQRLGPAYAHRARRSTVVLDAVVRRVAKSTETSNAEKAAGEAEGGHSRLTFLEPTFLEFAKDCEVSRLFVWGPVGGRRLVPLPKPQPLTTKRLKSILRVRLDPVQPVFKEQTPLAPPVVQTVSVSVSAATPDRHVDLTGGSGRVSGGSSSILEQQPNRVDNDTSMAQGDDEEDDSVEKHRFSKRHEQSSGSPPPNFEVTLDEGLVSLSDLVLDNNGVEDKDGCVKEGQQHQQEEEATSGAPSKLTFSKNPIDDDPSHNHTCVE